MTSNLNIDHHKILQTILAGKPEFKDILSQPKLRQFAHGVSVDFNLPAIERDSVGEYIHHRLRVVGTEENYTY